MKRSLYTLAIVALTASACGGGKSNPVAPSSAAAPGLSGFGTLSARAEVRSVAAAGAPAAPSGLTAVATGSTVTLTWTAPAGADPATGYIIEAGSAPGLANLTSFPTGGAATSFSASGVGSGTYYVRVRATNASGTSAASNEATLVVGGSTCTAPGAPSGLTTSVSGTTVVLSWSAGSGSPTSYIVEAGSATGLSNLVNSDLGSAATTLTATGVGAGTYFVRMRSKNACGTSAASNEATLVVGTTTGGPLSGSWSGPIGSSSDPNPDRVAWTATQNGSTVTGSLRYMVYQGSSNVLTINTTMTGTISGSQVALTFVLPAGSWVPLGGPAACVVTVSGTVTATATTLTGPMTATFDPSCTGTVSRTGASETNTLSLTKS